jgi:hypothetical protein
VGQSEGDTIRNISIERVIEAGRLKLDGKKK